MADIGFSEIIVIFMIALVYLIPIVVAVAAAVWVNKALKNIRADQEAIKSRLGAIESALQSNPSR
jgi:hypothetical protein